MIEFAQVHPIWFGIIETVLVCGFVAAIGAMFGAIWNSKEGGDAADAARAAGLRPQPPTASSRSSIDYRKGEE